MMKTKMNTLDYYIEKVIVPPHQVIDDDLCCWEMTCIITCGYGASEEKVFREISRGRMLVMLEDGYTWQM